MTLHKNFERRRALEKAILEDLVFFFRGSESPPALGTIANVAARAAMNQIEKAEGDRE